MQRGGEIDMTPQKCRSCGAAIYWLKNDASGTLAPIDAEPATDGNIMIVDAVTYKVAGCLEEPMLTSVRHKNHFATCPQAKNWKHENQG